MSTIIVERDRYALTAAAVTDTGASPTERQAPALFDRLRCPKTGRTLQLSDHGDCLETSDSAYPIRQGTPLLLTGENLERARAWRSPAPQRRRQRVWSLVPSPVSGARQARYLREFLDRRQPGQLTVNIGAAGWDLGPDVVNVDLLPFAGVDLCADIHELPFADGDVDTIVCTGVLEHIADPQRAVQEFHRVLRPGGEIFCTVPFLQAYHEDPEDYRRYTATGLRQLFAAFATTSVRPSHGAGSALAWIAGDTLATALSLGNNLLHTFWLMSLRLALAPCRLLDRLSEGNPLEHRCCSAFLIEAIR